MKSFLFYFDGQFHIFLCIYFDINEFFNDNFTFLKYLTFNNFDGSLLVVNLVC